MNSEQNERWAKMFRWRLEYDQQSDPTVPWWIPPTWPENGCVCVPSDLPNFAALDGPYVGPAIKELIQADWQLNPYINLSGKRGFYWVKLHSGSKAPCVIDADLGICTMLALEAKRAAERETEGA